MPRRARLAAIAEEVATRSSARSVRPAGRVHVILVNQSDQPNGWATPVPYNLIEITAAGPGGESLIGNTDDWLRLVFTHEYTHIVHLGRSGGWIGGLRRVFGRNPALFPNLALPLWAIEGMATFEESARDRRAGSTPATSGRSSRVPRRAAAVRAARSRRRRAGRLARRATRSTPTAALFHRYLADTYGGRRAARG